MTRVRRWMSLQPVLALACAALALGPGGPDRSAAADEPKTPSLPAALTKVAPESVEDLKAIQQHVRKVLDKVIPATVGVRIGQSQGSGVIIKKDDGYYVMTAGHVSGAANRDVVLVLHDGKTIKGKTQGANRGIDSGLIKIAQEGDFAHVEMGSSTELQKGHWCIATGHPTGYKPGRTPVVRLGRIQNATKSVIQTDCALVGGDSGGPLFDMTGKIIGIHSRIGGSLAQNMHVPVDTYHETWDRLAKGEVFGGPLFGGRGRGAYLGVELDLESKDCRIAKIIPGAAAEKAGLKTGDVLLKFDSQSIANADDLRPLLARKRPGDEVAIEVRRGDEVVTLKATLERQPPP